MIGESAEIGDQTWIGAGTVIGRASEYRLAIASYIRMSRFIPGRDSATA